MASSCGTRQIESVETACVPINSAPERRGDGRSAPVATRSESAVDVSLCRRTPKGRLPIAAWWVMA